jgi:hypothetical protein
MHNTRQLGGGRSWLRQRWRVRCSSSSERARKVFYDDDNYFVYALSDGDGELCGIAIQCDGNGIAPIVAFCGLAASCDEAIVVVDYDNDNDDEEVSGGWAPNVNNDEVKGGSVGRRRAKTKFDVAFAFGGIAASQDEGIVVLVYNNDDNNEEDEGWLRPRRPGGALS